MLSERQLSNLLGRILQIGIMISFLFVMAGGISFLLEHGNEQMASHPIMTANYDIDILKIWHSNLLSTPVGWIELGLIILVMAQITRVAALFLYYAAKRDVWFTLFSFFILSVILYSLIWQ